MLRIFVMRFAALLVLGAGLVVPGFVRAAEPLKPAVVAVLDPGNSDRVPLLEVKLAAEPGLTLVERATVDAVLKEQQLQAAFGPQGAGERVSLGKVFKADVLVMVRAVPQAIEPALEVVVSETGGGLRLLVRAVPLTKDAATDADALAAAVREGLQHRTASIEEIVAVPPFVSQDLGYEFEHLKGAFATLVENAAMARPGVVAVELAEAEAIAKELALAAPYGALQRRLPLYVLGEFRHSPGPDRRVTIRLRAERGGKPIGTDFERELEPDDAPLAIRNWTIAAVVASTGMPPPAADDPKAEARQLAARARDFKRLGNWPEALALFEAALLLDPQQLEIHVDVLKMIGPPIHDLQVRNGRREAKTTEEFVRLYRRGLRHIEAFVIRGGDMPKYRTSMPVRSLIQAYREAGADLRISENSTPQQRELMQDAQRFERALFRRLIPKTYHLQDGDHMDVVHAALNGLTDAERLEMIAEFIGELPDVPRSVEVAGWYAQTAAWAAINVGAERTAFEARLAAGRSAAYRAAAAEFPHRFQFALDRSKPPRYVPQPRHHVERPDGVTFTPLSFVVDGPHPKPYDPYLPLNRIQGVLRLGPATDLIWSGMTFYLMKEKGMLRPVAGLNGLSGVNVHMRFDGEFVWLSRPGFGDRRPLLFVLDPASERVWDASEAEGLPLLSAEQQKLQWRGDAYPLAPLGPGRICLAGRLGDRGWVGVATFTKTTGLASVKIVAEARDVPDPLDEEQWKSTTLAFSPAYIQPLADPNGTPAARVLVGRSNTGPFSRADLHPLLIDPAGVAKPEVIREPVGLFSMGNGGFDCCQEQGGEVYFFRSDNNTPGRLRKAKLPGPTLETVAEGMPARVRMIQADGNRWHAVEDLDTPRKVTGRSKRMKFQNDTLDQIWWTVEPGAKTPRVAGTDLPTIVSLAVSGHYGLVAIVIEDPDNSSLLQKVDVQPEPQ